MLGELVVLQQEGGCVVIVILFLGVNMLLHALLPIPTVTTAE
jgi:hypothetical protein